MILYTIITTRVGEFGLEDVESTFESFHQATFWARDLASRGLPVRWAFEFVKAPKQFEFMF